MGKAREFMTVPELARLKIYINGQDNTFSVSGNGVIELYTTQAGANQFSASSVGSIVAGTTYTVGISRIGASVRIYKNGVDVTSTAGSHTNPETCARTAKIGIADDKVTYPFNGLMVFMLGYSRSLTAPEQMNIHLLTK